MMESSSLEFRVCPGLDLMDFHLIRCAETAAPAMGTHHVLRCVRHYLEQGSSQEVGLDLKEEVW